MAKSTSVFQHIYQHDPPVRYREFSREFFDLMGITECHRGSAAADSAWREILDYFRRLKKVMR